jgi:hypothetical protein
MEDFAMKPTEIDPKIIADLKKDSATKIFTNYEGEHLDFFEQNDRIHVAVSDAVRNYAAAVVDSAFAPNDRSGPQRIADSLAAVKTAGSEVPDFDPSFELIKNSEAKIRRDVATAIREWESSRESGYLSKS